MSTGTSTTSNKHQPQPPCKPPPLLSRGSKQTKAPPSDTTRLLTALLDRKPAKKRARSSANKASNNGEAQARQSSQKTVKEVAATTKSLPINKRARHDNYNTTSTAWSRVTDNKPSLSSLRLNTRTNYEVRQSSAFGDDKGLKLLPTRATRPKKAKNHTSLPERKNSKNKENDQKTQGRPRPSITSTAVEASSSGLRQVVFHDSLLSCKSRKTSVNPYATAPTGNSQPTSKELPDKLPPSKVAPAPVPKQQSTEPKPTSTALHFAGATTTTTPVGDETMKDTGRSNHSSSMSIQPIESQQLRDKNPYPGDDSSSRSVLDCGQEQVDCPSRLTPKGQHKIASTSSSMGLNLAVGRSSRREKQSRLPTSANDEQKLKGVDDLVVMGRMMSASASSTVLPVKMRNATDGGEGSSFSFGTNEPKIGNRILPPMKALCVGGTANTKSHDIGATGSKRQVKQQRSVNNDNFVRLNMRNGAGSCRGARNKKSKNRFQNSKWKKGNFYQQQNNDQASSDWDDDNPNQLQDRRPPQRETETIQRAETFRAGVDPLDDYLDGVLVSQQSGADSITKPLLRVSSSKVAGQAVTNAPKETRGDKKDEVPKCTRHQRQCKLLVVKKTTTGNKGRKFYCCSMPRGEQCDHFQWADDTVEAAKRALLKNASHSGFIARQVAAYMERFQKLTVPELRETAERRNLDPSGKKQQLLLRLSIWVRDELADVTSVVGTEPTDETDIDHSSSAPEDEVIDTSGLLQDSRAYENKEDGDSEDVSESSDDLSDDEELDIYDAPSSRTDNGPAENVADDEAGVCATENRLEPLKNREKSKREEDPPQNHESQSCKIREMLSSLFGYSHLREGQEWAIKRCLDKQKTLLVAPTGFGKSMCYVLPAALMDGVCIVVSPLISLIQDQLRELPPRVPAATLSGSLSTAAIASIVDDVIRKRIKVLFVSPERLASSSFQRLFQPKWNKETNSMERPFPPVSLLAVDEAHCLSQWAHNFRPSYLRLGSLLDKIKPQSVLAITATAGRQVVKDICQTLDIDVCSGAAGCRASQCSCGVWTMKSDRDNIDVKTFIAASQELRLPMLMKLLKPCGQQPKEISEKDEDIQAGCLANGSVIVYVWRQKDTEVVAESIQASGVPGGVVCYHGGMNTGARSNAYSKFMRGKARICVATVAFGLGVNKADVQGVIHMYLPASPEHFLQEIGRAGRDDREAKAVALVLKEEVLVRHSQVHTDLIANSQLKSIFLKFRDKVSAIIDSLSWDHRSQVPAIGVPVPLEEFSLLSDCKAETIETIFSLLELRAGGSSSYLQVEGTTIDQVTISFKRRKISKSAEKEPVIRCIEKCAICVDPPVGEAPPEVVDRPDAFACERENSRQRQFVAYSFGSYRFSVTECANLLGPTGQPRHVFAALRRLQSNGEIELKLENTSKGRALRIVLNNEGLSLFLDEDRSSAYLESLVSDLGEQLSAISAVSANKVLDINYMMHEVAEVVSKSDGNTRNRSKSESLKKFQQLTKQYFNCREGERLCLESQEALHWFVHDFSEKEVLIDSLSLISEVGKENQLPGGEALKLGEAETLDYTALAVTKFLHGIATVRIPFSTGFQHRLFGKWQTVRFDELLVTVERLLRSQCAQR